MPDAPDPNPRSATRAPAARCVVWSPQGHDPSPALLQVLERRGEHPATVQSAHETLAEVCVAQQDGSRCAVILDGIQDHTSVRESAERFAPVVVFWVFEPGANSPLRRLVEEEQDAAEASSVAEEPEPPAQSQEPTPNLQPEPDLKLAQPACGTETTPRRPAELSSADVLDDDELEMLLAGERDSN